MFWISVSSANTLVAARIKSNLSLSLTPTPPLGMSSTSIMRGVKIEMMPLDTIVSAALMSLLMIFIRSSMAAVMRLSLPSPLKS